MSAGLVTVCSMGHQRKVAQKACIMGHVTLPIAAEAVRRGNATMFACAIQTMSCIAP